MHIEHYLTVVYDASGTSVVARLLRRRMKHQYVHGKWKAIWRRSMFPRTPARWIHFPKKGIWVPAFRV